MGLTSQEVNEPCGEEARRRISQAQRRISQGAKKPGGKRSRGQKTRGRISQGVKKPGAEWQRGEKAIILMSYVSYWVVDKSKRLTLIYFLT